MAVPTDYDRVPYRSLAYPHTHPARLAALSVAYGGTPPPLAGARVLEVGCGAGGNLLPMAAGLPGTTFVGVDPASSAITEARAAADTLGLANLTLHPAGVEALHGEPPFDYVLAHGVLSWMPPAARQDLWAFLGRNVAPHGVVYLSFNVYPGWSSRGVVRDLLRWHIRGMEEPTDRIRAARALLATLVAETPPTTLWGAILHSEQRVVDAVDDWYLFHDHLAEHNQPFWFHEVAAEAERAGLSFVSDAEPARALCPSAALAAHATTGVEASQYGDLSRMTAFREGVWARDPAVTPGAPRPERVVDLGFWLRAGRLVDGERLRTPEGVTLTLGPGLARDVVHALDGLGPGPVPVAELVRRTGGEVGAVCEVLAHLWLGSEAVGAAWGGPVACSTLSARPTVFPWARLEAASAKEVTNLRHDRVPLTPLQRAAVTVLDGTRDRAALERALGESPELVAALVALVRAGLVVS